MRGLTSFMLLLFLVSGSAIAADAPAPASTVAAATPVASEAPNPNQAASERLQRLLKLDYELFRAVTDGKVDEVKRLVNAGANPNTPSGAEKKRALNVAAAAGNKKIVEILLAAGADPNMRDGSGATAMVAAIVNDKGEVAKLIGAFRSGKITVEDLLKRTGVTIPLPPAPPVAKPAPSQIDAEIARLQDEIVQLKAKIAEADDAGTPLPVGAGTEPPSAARQLAPTTASVAPVPKGLTVSGSAFVIRQGGQSDILRGFHVTLIQETVPPQVLKKALTMVVLNYANKALDNLKRAADERKTWGFPPGSAWDPGEFAENEAKDAAGNAQKYYQILAKVGVPVYSAAALRLLGASGYVNVIRDFVQDLQIATTTTDVQGAYKFTNAPENAYIFAMFDTKDGFLLWAIPVKGDGSKDLFNDTALISK